MRAAPASTLPPELMTAAAGLPPASGRLRVALRVPDPRVLAGVLDVTGESEADVLVLALPRGERMPADAASGPARLLVLSDDPVLAADSAIPGVLPFAASASQVAAGAAAVAEGLRVRAAHPHPAHARSVLTRRETEVLAEVGHGLGNKAIARRLGISAHTVKYHLEAVFAKLGARSRAEAVSRGLREGWIEG
jgi:two-component system, NarL family, nitrate/nitrite response regulator NarL